MAIFFECKMCRGRLDILKSSPICKCEYCGTYQTIPLLDSEKKLNLFMEANRLRFIGDFENGRYAFENIVSEFPTEAEAYWGLCLCKYGIEYINDYKTGKKVPTCHKKNNDSILNDNNFAKACEYASVTAKRLYREEAENIDRIQRAIAQIAETESPYDIFISFKNEDSNGRTKDSVLAQDIYEALTEKGYRVFFSHITLESKSGQYEQYIFNALNTARVMLVIGTSRENLESDWVKNEWSRFLKMLRTDTSKTAYLCYADMLPEDIPDELDGLLRQNMTKEGFLQDLVHGIEKILPVGEATGMSLVRNAAPSVENLVKRGTFALKCSGWNEAEQSFTNALDVDAECAQAYMGKVMVKYRLTDENALVRIKGLSEESDFKRAVQFAKGDEKKQYILLRDRNANFFRYEDKRVKNVIDAKEAKAKHINELNAKVQRSNEQFERSSDALNENKPVFISKPGCMIPFFIVIWIVVAFIRACFLDGEKGFSAYVSTFFIGLGGAVAMELFVYFVGIGIHNLKTRKRFNALEKSAKKCTDELLNEIKIESENFICCCCGTILSPTDNNCVVCGCEYKIQVVDAIAMDNNEFRKRALDESVVPQDHDFMK